jgi:hypothetical protein
MSLQDHKSAIISWIKSSLSKQDDKIFDAIMIYLESRMTVPCNNIIEFKQRSTKSKGDFFEQFCLLYLNEVSDDMLTQLKLRRQDLGIDLIIQTSEGYIAVQVKYRVHNLKKLKTALGWGQLSTFYALCERTGPWIKHLVMTNCDYVSRKGMKNEKDWTIAIKSFQSTPRSVWLSMIDSKPGYLLNAKSSVSKINLSIEELRHKRLAFYNSKSTPLKIDITNQNETTPIQKSNTSATILVIED